MPREPERSKIEETEDLAERLRRALKNAKITEPVPPPDSENADDWETVRQRLSLNRHKFKKPYMRPLLFRCMFGGLLGLPLGYFLFALNSLNGDSGSYSMFFWLLREKMSAVSWAAFGMLLGALWHQIRFFEDH